MLHCKGKHINIEKHISIILKVHLAEIQILRETFQILWETFLSEQNHWFETFV
jgi:hypothetical protein